MSESIAAKARATLEAAALYEKAGGIAVSDWPQVSVLLGIANTQAQVSIAESLERLANAHTPFPREEPGTLSRAGVASGAGAYL